MAFESYYIRIDDRTSTQKAFISSTASNAILGGGFTNHKNGGCGELKIQLNPDTIQGTIQVGYIIRVVGTYDGGSAQTYYRGVIMELPKTGTTKQVYELVAQGFFWEAKAQTIVKYHEGDDTDEIVKAIIGDISTDSVIPNDTSQVSIAAPYTIGDFEAEYLNAADAIKLMAEIEGDVQYGCDSFGKVYFKDIDTAVKEYLHVGQHIESFDYYEDNSKIINRYIMQSKKLVGGGALTVVRSNAASITSYGLHTKVVQIPHLSDIDDVWEWALKMLTETKDPLVIADAKTKNFYKNVWPRGKVRIVSNGASYDLAIEAVEYTFDGTGGLRGDFVLGDRERIEFSTEIRELMQEIRTNQNNSISLTRIEHTRNEEFIQDSIVEAHELGLLSDWFYMGRDLKSFDADTSYHMWLYKPHEALCVPYDKTLARYRTNEIPALPTGEDIDSIRLHLDLDFYGKQIFEIDEDLNDDWWTNKTGWQVYDGRPKAENIPGGAGAHPLDFLQYNQSVSWPTYHKIRFGLTNQTLNPGVGIMYYYNYVDLNNRTRINIVNGAANCVFTWQKMVGGVGWTNIANYVGAKDIDYWVEIYSAPPPANATIKIYRSSDDTLMSTFTNNNVPSPGGIIKCGPDEWHNSLGNPALALLDWNEWDLNVAAATAIDLRISRDGGTTWTAVPASHGVSHQTVDLSAQPAGNSLIIRSDINHPCRIYGLGISY